MFYFVPLLQLL